MSLLIITAISSQATKTAWFAGRCHLLLPQVGHILQALQGVSREETRRLGQRRGRGWRGRSLQPRTLRPPVLIFILTWWRSSQNPQTFLRSWTPVWRRLF